MKYLLDTDHISILEWSASQQHASLASRMAAHPADEFAFSIVSFNEQTMGAHNFVLRARTNADLINGYRMFERARATFCSAIVLQMDAPAIAALDNLRALRLHVRAMDFRIAAIALANDLTLLTRNFRDFSRIPGLRMEDWTI